MNATITLPKPLGQAADRLAQRLGISLDQLYEEAIEEYVQSRQDDERYVGVTAALDRVYVEQNSELEPELSRLQSRALPRESW